MLIRSIILKCVTREKGEPSSRRVRKIFRASNWSAMELMGKKQIETSLTPPHRNHIKLFCSNFSFQSQQSTFILNITQCFLCEIQIHSATWGTDEKKINKRCNKISVHWNKTTLMILLLPLQHINYNDNNYNARNQSQFVVGWWGSV